MVPTRGKLKISTCVRRNGPRALLAIDILVASEHLTVSLFNREMA